MCACRPATAWWCRSPIATAASRRMSETPFTSAGPRRPARCSTNKRSTNKQEASMVFMINRRSALAGAGTLAAFPAAAQDNKRVVVGTWGGDYSRLLAKNIETPLLAPKGWESVHSEENAPPRKAKMLAEKSLRRGTSDVQGLSSTDMYEVSQQGIVETIDYSKMANAQNLMPTMKYPYGIGHIYSGKVILY